MERKINFIFFDLNLREPFINYEFISFMLEKKATHLKFSKEEYIFINKIFKNTISVIILNILLIIIFNIY